MIKELLPIGTVCTLKNQKKIMVIGFLVCNPKEPDVVYDYLGCPYPEGMIDPNMHFMFNHDRIDKIDYMGFVNDQENAFKKQMEELVNKKINNEQNN